MSLALARPRRKKAAAISLEEIAENRLARLRSWYDANRRDLPWRAKSGIQPDPYRVWLSEIMLQQTTVKAVGPYFAKFLARFPDVNALAAAPLEDVLRLWAGLGYYSRARNLHACGVTVAREHGGRFPQTAEGLQKLPGVGPYTAAAIAAIAFGEHIVPLDGNIERVVARLFAIEEPLPLSKPKLRELAQTFACGERSGDAAQALMDLGATICTPRSPSCMLCHNNANCEARARGDMEAFPRKVAKKEGKLRRGAAFVALRADGHVLLRSRPARGLLGGMTEPPGTEWSAEFKATDALQDAPLGKGIKWRKLVGAVSHTFTHFPLELDVYFAEMTSRARAPKDMRWIAVKDLHAEALPSVMRKVLAHALDKRVG